MFIKNIRDYLILFPYIDAFGQSVYAFNSISDQSAFFRYGNNRFALIRPTRHTVVGTFCCHCGSIGFSDYLCQPVLKRRKRIGRIYGARHEKGRISRLFAGETLVLVSLLWFQVWFLGFSFRKGLSLVALKLFAIELDKISNRIFCWSISTDGACFAIIFFIVMLFNVVCNQCQID